MRSPGGATGPKRIIPALAGGAALTYLLLLALPLLAVREQPEPEPDHAPVALVYNAAPEWQRTPEQQQFTPENYQPLPLDVNLRDIAEPAPNLFTPEPAPGGPGLALHLGLDLDAAANAAPAQSFGPASFELGQVDQAPRPLHQTPPEYPSAARQRRQTGSVELRFLVERDGNVSQVEVVKADPPGVFEDSAVRTVRKWRFSPGMRQGEAVRTWVRVPISFNLE
ncbi:MAG: energy transducer TonB [Desulfovibrionaceae bacterium]